MLQLQFRVIELPYTDGMLTGTHMNTSNSLKSKNTQQMESFIIRKSIPLYLLM